MPDPLRLSPLERYDLRSQLDFAALRATDGERAGLTLLKGYRNGWWLTVVPFVRRFIIRTGDHAAEAAIQWQRVPALEDRPPVYWEPRDQAALNFAHALATNAFALSKYDRADYVTIIDAINDATAALRR